MGTGEGVGGLWKCSPEGTAGSAGGDDSGDQDSGKWLEFEVIFLPSETKSIKMMHF